MCISSCADLRLAPGQIEFCFILVQITTVVIRVSLKARRPHSPTVRRTYYLICHNFSHEFSNRKSDDQCQKLILEGIGRLRDG